MCRYMFASEPGELVVTRETLQQGHLPDGAQPILLRMGVAAVADVAALTLDGHRGAVPPQPSVDVWVTAKVAARDPAGHGRREEHGPVRMIDEVRPPTAVARDRRQATLIKPRPEGGRDVQRIGRVPLSRRDRRQVPDRPSDVGCLGVHAPPAPEVAQAAHRQRPADSDDDGPLPPLRQAELGQEVDVSGRSVAEAGQLVEQCAQVTAEPAGNDLASVLDEHDVWPQQGRVLADPTDQAVAMVVVQVIARHACGRILCTAGRRSALSGGARRYSSAWQTSAGHEVARSVSTGVSPMLAA